MKFVFHSHDEVIDVYYESSKEKVHLGTLLFVDENRQYRLDIKKLLLFDIKKLLLLALETDNPRLKVLD